jgi:PAS domain-containing protein
MGKKISGKPDASKLRQVAEEVLKKKSSKSSVKLSESDTLKLLHELEVHQIELEMQNEELVCARDEAKIANDRFISVYDFAHTGYFTIDYKAKIHELNLTGAVMLGKERSTIVNRNFKDFVTLDTLHIFNDFIQKVLKTRSKENCHVRLIIKGEQSRFVKIESIVSGDEEKFQLTVVDETMYKHTEELLKLKAHELEQFDDFMLAKNRQMTELKKEINSLLKKLGEKDKFKIEEQ